MMGDVVTWCVPGPVSSLGSGAVRGSRRYLDAWMKLLIEDEALVPGSYVPIVCLLLPPSLELDWVE